MSIAGCAIDFNNAIAGAGPDVRGSLIQTVNTVVYWHVHNSLTVALVDDYVHIGEVGSAVPAWCDGYTNHAVACLTTLISHSIKLADGLIGKVWS